jgi:diguanylate cyclase (GGDEF)-like protein
VGAKVGAAAAEMTPMNTGEPSEGLLLAIIRMQNEIAAGGLDLDAVMDLVVRRAQDLTQAGGAVLELLEGEELVYSVGAGSARNHLGTRAQVDASPSGMCVRTNDFFSSDNTDNDDRADMAICSVVGAGSMICVPIAVAGHTAAVLTIYSPAIYAFRNADIETLKHLSGLIGAHMAQAGDFGADSQSRVDPLTGLANRRAYDEALAAEVARARRHDRGIALCIFDLNDFQAINDELGHPAGDEVLCGVASILDNGRFSDAAFRVGDDQFALILPETDDSGAEAAAQRLTGVIAAARLGDGRATVSYGVATGGPGAIELHERAEAALATMKSGRTAAQATVPS